MRGMLAPHIEARIFNASAGGVVGPFESEDGLVYELFLVEARHEAVLDAASTEAIKTALHRDWLRTQMEAQRIEFLS